MKAGNSQKFIRTIRSIIHDYLDENGLGRTTKLATIDSISGTRASVIFDGESEATQKQFTKLSSYTPVVGDRVLMAQSGSRSWTILGKVE